MATVLLVEDDPGARQGLELALRRLGYGVHPAASGEAALHGVREATVDVVVLDVMLPGLDGFEVCRRLRRDSDVPVIILTARGDDFDIVGGLEAGANDYGSPLIPTGDTNALTVDAASLGLPASVGTGVAHGSYLNPATARGPVAVLGAAAAQRLGIDKIFTGERIWVGNMWFYLTGILRPAVLAPGIDSSVLVGYPAAQKYLHFNGHPTTIYLRATSNAVTRVDNLLAAQANPQDPAEVDVSQPSAALTAQVDAKGAFGTLLLGLGAVALLVGAVGVANIMIISVLERRSEIGLRRALGPTKNHIRAQFLAEAILLTLAGGAAGVAAGAAATASYAHAKGWATVIPPVAWAGGLGATILIGAAAGLLPALRAARLSPTRALWSL